MPPNELARNLRIQEPSREFSHANAACIPNIAPLPCISNFARTSNRETEANYRDVLFQHGRYRVILCKDAIQWIIQRNRRADGVVPRARWLALSYCTTRSSLKLDWRRHTGIDVLEIELLPDRCKPDGQNRKLFDGRETEEAEI